MKAIILAALLAPLSAGAAFAQVAIAEIRAQLVLEHSGRLSDDIAQGKRAFVNAVIGGDLGEPADAVLVTLSFTGPKNTRSSDKIARDLASVTVRQAARTGERILLKRAYGGFQFGESGRVHKAFLLDGATCAPLEIEVKVGRSARTAKLDFRCGE